LELLLLSPSVLDSQQLPVPERACLCAAAPDVCTRKRTSKAEERGAGREKERKESEVFFSSFFSSSSPKSGLDFFLFFLSSLSDYISPLSLLHPLRPLFRSRAVSSCLHNCFCLHFPAGIDGLFFPSDKEKSGSNFPEKRKRARGKNHEGERKKKQWSSRCRCVVTRVPPRPRRARSDRAEDARR